MAFLICLLVGRSGVGDAAGKLHVLEMPQSLKQGPSTEVSPLLQAGMHRTPFSMACVLLVAWSQLSMIEAFFEREISRAKYVGKRLEVRYEEKKKLDEKKALAAVRAACPRFDRSIFVHAYCVARADAAATAAACGGEGGSGCCGRRGCLAVGNAKSESPPLTCVRDSFHCSAGSGGESCR